ncbi:MAG: polymer-forming cytoskeletal protein [bacterium]|nr:polymer-forming cytoskeletal protein [bacterium]
MGFFSDLKEDLSQAVNELLPEDEQIKGGEEPAEEAEEQEFSLDEMLKNIDDIRLEAEDFASLETPTPSPVQTQDQEEADVPEAPEPVEEEASGPDAAEEEAEQDDEMERMLEKMLEETSAVVQQEEEPKAVTVEESKGAEKKMETTWNRENRDAVDETSVITEGMTITGDITSEGSVDVIGTVNGNIDALGKLNITGHINGNSKAAEIYAESAKINGEVVSEGAIKIGSSSVIIGNITATSAAIAGAVKGDIDVRGPVILDTTAIVMGNIKSKSVQINNGAVIEGMCSQCYADVSPTSFFDEYKPESHKSKSK